MQDNPTGVLHPRRLLLQWTLSLAVVIGLVAVVVETAENTRHRQTQRVAALEKLSTIRAELEGALNGEMLLARSLITMIVIHADIDEETFFRTASHFFKEAKHIRNIGLARDTTLEFVYPVAGNEAAIGLDYRKLPAQWPAVEKAIISRRTVVAGPVNLVQGGLGIIGRTPIYLEPAEGQEAPPQYFGLLSVVMDVPSLFAAAGLLDEDSPFTFAIRGTDGLGDQGAVFHGPAKLFAGDAVSLDVEFFDNTWVMAAAPKEGWELMSPRAAVYRTALALLFIVFLWRKNREIKLQTMLSRQRDELAKNNLELQQTLNEVRELKGLLPICCCCKKIRDDQGYWSQIESYISKYTDAEFSHGYCPDCLHAALEEAEIDSPEVNAG